MAKVLISGATRGLGRAIALECAARGHSVFAGSRTGDEVVPGCETVTLNVRDLDSVAQAVASVGTIDWLVNNAGIHDGRTLRDIDQDTFKHVLDVNVLGAWRLTRAALPTMREGSIVAMISSLSGLVGLSRDGAYAASKFALEGMSQSLAGEVAGDGIGVCLFEPGAIATGFAGSQGGMSAEVAAREIVEILEHGPRQLRYPVGAMADELMDELRVDRGADFARIVERFSGVRLPFAEVAEGPTR